MSLAADQTSDDDSRLAFAALLPGIHGPLQHLVAAAELLDRQRLKPEARACARAILESGRTLLNVLDDLLRLESAALDPADPVPVKLADIAEEIESLWRLQTAPSAGRLLISCKAPPSVCVAIDAGAAKAIVNTLIRRALVADPSGVIETSLVLDQTNAQIYLTIAQGRIGPGEGDGSLAVAERLCRLSGGTLRRRPRPGGGELVEVALPAPIVENIAEAVEDDASVLPAQTHVLIVDDNATNRMVAAALCEMFGCTTETADDGVDAVEAARSTRFDLILMDIRMPRMDGVEATRAIRRLPGSLGRTPIVALTANGDPEAARLYLAAGMDGVVEKPIKPERLLETLQAVLEPIVSQAASEAAA